MNSYGESFFFLQYLKLLCNIVTPKFNPFLSFTFLHIKVADDRINQISSLQL